MPVIAVVAAAGSMALGGASAIGAVIAGTATLATTLEAVAAVGATLGAVGAVTGDKGLQTAGLVMGAVGGIGALAANAGVFGASATTQSLFGSSSSAASDAAAIQPVTIDPMGGPVVSGGTAITAMSSVSPSQDVINSITQPTIADLQSGIVAPTGDLNTASTLATTGLGQQTAAAAGNASALTPSPTSTLGGSTGGSNIPVPTPNPGVGSATGAIPPSQLEAPQGAGTVTGIPGVPAANLAAPSDLSTALTQPSVSQLESGITGSALSKSLGNLLKFANKNPTVAFGAMQAGGSLLNGLFSPLTTPKVAALNAQAAANRAAAALTTQQIANMQAPLPVASRGTVASPAVTGQPQGLINTPPPTAANVTGTANTIVPGGGSFGGGGATGTYGI